MIAKLRGYNNIAKGREETKESRILQSVSRFLSEIVACTNPKVISTSLKFFWMSRIDKEAISEMEEIAVLGKFSQ